MSRFFVVLLFLAVFSSGCGDHHERAADARVADPALESDDEEEVEEAEIPPAGAKPLSEILQLLEETGYGPIVEVELEDGVWEVEALHYGSIVEIRIDPVTGEPVEDATESEAQP